MAIDIWKKLIPRYKYEKNETHEPMIFHFHYHCPKSPKSEVQIHLFRHLDQMTKFVLNYIVFDYENL